MQLNSIERAGNQFFAASGAVIRRIATIASARAHTVTCLTAVCVCLASTSPATAAVSREEVERDVRAVEAFGLRANAYAAEARRLTRAALTRQAQAAGVRALLSCDRATEAEVLNKPKIEQLSGFSVGSETKRAYRTRYEKAAWGRALIEEQLADLAASVPPEDRLVATYLLQRDNIKTRLRAEVTDSKFTDDNWVIEQLSLLAAFPVRWVTEKFINLDNVGRCRRDGDNVRLADGIIVSLSTNVLPSVVGVAATKPPAGVKPTVTALPKKIDHNPEQPAKPTPVIVTNMTVSSLLMVMPATNVMVTQLQAPPVAQAALPVGANNAKPFEHLQRKPALTSDSRSAGTFFRPEKTSEEQASHNALHGTSNAPVVVVATPSPRTSTSTNSTAASSSIRRAAGNGAAGKPVTRVWIWAGIGCVLLLAALVALRGVCGAMREPELLPIQEDKSNPSALTALVINEREIPAEEDGKPRIVRNLETVPMVSNVPVTFGTNPEFSTCVVEPVAGFEMAELFRITLTDTNTLCLKATEDALCNEKRVPKKGVLLNGDRPFRVRIGQREWELTATADGVGRNAVSTLFDRIQPKRQAAVEAVSNQR